MSEWTGRIGKPNGKPRWRGNGEELALRRIIRDLCPEGAAGFVVEDVDMVVRRFKKPLDPIGQFRLVEHKYGDAELGPSKEMTFGLMDALFRVADPNMGVYLGLYVLRTPEPTKGEPDPILDENTIFDVNGERLTRDQFIAWLNQDFYVPPVEPSPPYDRMIERLRRYTPHVVKKETP